MLKGRVPENVDSRRFYIQLQTEAFAYLEVALGLPRVVRMCLNDVSTPKRDRNRLPLLALFMAPSGMQSISGACAQVRLLSFIIARG